MSLNGILLMVLIFYLIEYFLRSYFYMGMKFCYFRLYCYFYLENTKFIEINSEILCLKILDCLYWRITNGMFSL